MVDGKRGLGGEGALEYQGEAGDYKDYGIGYRGDVLIEPALQVPEFAAKFGIGNDVHSDFVADEDDVRGWRGQHLQ